jgi:signal transduction histidine kinase
VVLVFYARKRREGLPFKHLFWLFGTFIAACGTTHLMGYVITFSPMYRLDGLIKLITAIASWGTVVALGAITPRALAMRMPEDLEKEIGERKKAEAELALMNSTLEDRTKQLQMANAELESFCYTVAHDLRGPLRAIVGNSRLAIEDAPALDDSTRSRLERLGVSALQMSKLIDDLLGFARLAKTDVSAITVDVTTLALGIAEELKGDYPINFKVQPGLMAHADPRLLSLVLHNLMENSCKYADTTKDGYVEVGSTGSEFFVRDNGIGFDMAYLPKLFEPFSRLDTQTPIPGTGIGLANAKRIVERHGGSIRAEGALGVGASFYFSLATASSAIPTA